jgi:hypothetical protein
MQYSKGTVTATNGSQVITGDIQFFGENVEAGDLFLVVGDNTSYEVGSVDSDTQLTLTANYAGDTASGVQYVIHRDFTPIKGLPYPQKGDIETAVIIKRALMMIEALLP